MTKKIHSRFPARWSPALLLAGFLLAVSGPSLRGQVQVDLEFNERLYILYEPIIATVTITNMAGRDVLLFDDEGNRWFTFHIETGDGRSIPGYPTEGELSPLLLEAGQTVRRRINITPLYPVRDYGRYRVRANIYFPAMSRYFSSPYRSFDVSDGRVLWRQEVGVPNPEGPLDQRRLFSLIRFETGTTQRLYVRVENPDNNVIFSTFALGRLLVGQTPEAIFDRNNHLHVLVQSNARIFHYAEVGLDGQILERTRYIETNTRPRLVRAEDGRPHVRGGIADVPVERVAEGEGEGEEGAGPAKLSDRPSGFRPAQ